MAVVLVVLVCSGLAVVLVVLVVNQAHSAGLSEDSCPMPFANPIPMND
jgi:hypothetical protein